MKLHLLLKGIIACAICVSIQAQSSTTRLSINESPIEDQFTYVAQRSDDVENFKLIKRWHFYTLKNHVLDTIKAQQQELADAYLLIKQKQGIIDSMALAGAEIQDKLHKAVTEKEELVFLGVALNKALYNKLVWSIIMLLVLATVLAMFLFKRSHVVTRETQMNLDEIKDEFEAFRKRTLEREEGIVRKYHTEINKLKGRTGNNVKIQTSNGGLTN